ncbi:MAG: hypothetical protein JXA42_17095 [Anaerolineales bacterium]|nr:hypothetical protein [Anaerolineales bacterium]
MGKPTVKTRMRALLDEIDYDFSHFTLDDFVHWLEKWRERQIIFVPRDMPSTLFGAWVKAGGTDYIFFDKNTISIHQAHIQLHEMAHMICQHPTVDVESDQTRAILLRAGAKDFSSCFESLLLRSAHTDQVEEEAEMLTSLIQERVMSVRRLNELDYAIIQEGEFASYFAAYIEAMEKDG